MQLLCGCVAVPVNWFFDIISSFFAEFENVVQSLGPCETRSYSASHQAPNYVQLSQRYPLCVHVLGEKIQVKVSEKNNKCSLHIVFMRQVYYNDMKRGYSKPDS